MNARRTLNRNIARQKAKTGKPNNQTVLNNILWKIIMQNGGAISYSCEEIRQVPENACLQGNIVSGKYVVVASIRPSKNGLWLPPGEISEC
jgi:hypothetical protein